MEHCRTSLPSEFLLAEVLTSLHLTMQSSPPSERVLDSSPVGSFEHEMLRFMQVLKALALPLSLNPHCLLLPVPWRSLSYLQSCPILGAWDSVKIVCMPAEQCGRQPTGQEALEGFAQSRW